MTFIKQRSWIVIPIVACAFAITLIAMRSQPAVSADGLIEGVDGPGTLFGIQTGKQLLGIGADWSMEGLNPARTRAREEPLAQPLTKQRVVTIPGDVGDGSPPVLDKNILLVEAPDDLRAVDMNSGKQRWLAPLAGTYISPAVADGRVYVRSEADNKGQLLALDLKSGKQLWAFTPKHISTSTTSYQGGHLTSPVVSEGRVIVGAGNQVYALDAATGHGVWAYQAKDLITSSATIHNNQIYIADFTHIYALDFASGKQLWSYATQSSISFAPIATGQTLFATNGSNMVALDSASGKERWTTHYPDIELIPGAASGSLVYIKSTHDLYALDTETGNEIWNFRDPNFVSLPAVAGKDMFVVTGMGPNSALLAIDASTGTKMWRMPVADLANSAPVISGQTLYVRTTDGRVVSYWH